MKVNAKIIKEYRESIPKKIEGIIRKLEEIYPEKKPTMVLQFISLLTNKKINDKREILTIYTEVTKKSSPGIEEEIKTNILNAINDYL